MLLRSKKRFFTFLELIIAIIILLIITGLLAVIFRVAMRNYNKGMIYSEIAHELTGGFMLINNDIRRIVPITDKKNVFFKPKKISFITLTKNKNKQSRLELIRYEINYDEISRTNALYPDNVRYIDNNSVVIFKGLQNPKFEYIYEKTKKKNKKENEGIDNSDLTKIDSTDTEDTADSSDSLVDIKFPTAIKLENTIEIDKTTKDFSMLFIVPKFIIERHATPDSESGTDTASQQAN